MRPLAEIVEAVDNCLAAAWVDGRTGVVLECHVDDRGLRAAGSAAEYQPDVFATSAIDAATEVLRAQERPPRMVLLSRRHVHIVQRVARDPHRALVVICERSPNIGLAVALVRSFAEAEAT